MDEGPMHKATYDCCICPTLMVEYLRGTRIVGAMGSQESGGLSAPFVIGHPNHVVIFAPIP